MSTDAKKVILPAQDSNNQNQQKLVSRIKFMRVAAKEAAKNLSTVEGGPFGAVIVKDGKIISQAHNQVLKENDPTCHAEIQAIRAACKLLGTHNLRGCELYASAQPCPMCLSAIIWANIATVYYGNTAKDAAAIGFRDDAICNFILGGSKDTSILKLVPMDRKDTLPTFAAYKAQKLPLY